MSRSDLTDILAVCLKQVEAGSAIEEVVTAYPDQAGELKDLLQVALSVMPPKGAGAARRIPASAQIDSRRRLLARAKELQRQSGAVSLRAILRFLRLNLGSAAFAIAALLLLFVGLNSAKALPGDGLYPVKLAAEQAEISLSGSAQNRVTLETTYDGRRADEVAQMILMKRTGRVRFGGFLVQTLSASEWQVGDIPLVLNQTLEKQAQDLAGAYVEISGQLGPQGKVIVEAIKPQIEMIEGTITSLDKDGWKIGVRSIRITAATTISGAPRIGAHAVIRAASLKNGSAVLAVSAEIGGGDPTAASTLTATPKPSQTETQDIDENSIMLPLPTLQETVDLSKRVNTPEPGDVREPTDAVTPQIENRNTPRPAITQETEGSNPKPGSSDGYPTQNGGENHNSSGGTDGSGDGSHTGD